ncbi:uncharacterized protein N7511_009070 [Penicillium nucicola]|uniref:uncharacterized protein n=1 Tax=Penicillium nucicola TaxID=1850975 RepID=UPI0025451B51|nr:uncharacterized protein N7511_009070 [Penicillium nucicola]KAJ5747374.1 hypothetical protein N7511_009070 [Penicillium nucicola]
MENSREEPDKTGIVHAGSLPDLVDENGNVVLDDVAQIHAVKRASESVLGNSLAQPIQDNKPDSRSGTEELETHQTTEVTDEISDIESLPYGVKPNPDEERALAHMELDIDVTKTKKKKRRPKTKRGLGAPTGFEPFFADAPLTPDESQEIKKIYDPRYDEAIKRFLFKRRLEPRRRHLFLKYLQYGGVNINQKYGQGVSPQELKEMTKEEGMEARNYTVVSPEWATEGNIAFDTVLKGYLGGYYLDYFSPDDEGEIMVVTGTIKNFLTFLLYHDVCPEYRDDIEKARNTCDLAAKELWKARQVVQNGPGDFNKACSMLFGGNYFDDIDDPEIWETFAEQNRMTQESARWVLKYAIAAVGPDARAIRFKELAETEQFKVKQVEDIDGFEIISIEQPNPLTVAFYKDMAPNLTPVGVVRAKEFRDPAKGEFNLSKLEEEKWKRGEAPSYEFDFLVEGDLLAHCFLGMKALTKVFELNCGIHFFDEIMVCLPSFYVFLANDLMIDYKGPKTKEPTDKWIIMRAEHRKAMEQLAGPKLSDREQARALLKDVTPGADYDAAFGKWKPIPADTKLGFEYDVVPQPGVRAEDEMGIIFPQYDGQKKNEDEIIVKNISEKGGITQGDDTGQIKPKEWWTPEQWWGGEEWYGLMKEWKPTRTPSEHCPEKKTIVKECFSSSKKEENFDQVNANLCSLEQFIKRMDAEMKEEAESLTGKEMGSFSRWLSFAKSHLKNEKFQMMKSQGSVQTEPPNEKTSKNDLERSMQVDGANNIE